MLTFHEIARITEHAELLYPSVCCGVVMARGDRSDDRLFIACDNAREEVHEDDPHFCAMTARDGYYVAPPDLLRIATLEGRGYRVCVIYYSRVDKDASFSETSRYAATADGHPMHPEAVYLPVSVRRGRVAEMRAFQWDGGCREFVETLLLPVAIGPRNESNV